MVQHLGKPSVPVVREGEEVARGQRIARFDGFMSVSMHAPASGVVRRIGLTPTIAGKMVPGIYLEPFAGSTQEVHDGTPCPVETAEPAQIIDAIQDAGVVGLGGAAFPTHVKLTPPEGKNVETLVINGCECEPYLTTDHRTMAEFPKRVHLGIRIMMRCLGVEKALVGIERNKPDAIAAMEAAAPDDLDVTILPLTVKYPQGAEKMLIKSVLDREVPSGKLPLDVGVVVQNVASVATIAEAFETGLPLVERIVTVTGRGVRKPANLIVPIGTRLRDLFAACGGLTDDAHEIVMGGPMMGVSQHDLDVPVLKGTTGVVVLRRDETKKAATYPCIRCGHCLDACPVFLNPQLLGSLARTSRHDEMEAEHLWDCMLCGCCSYVCPSHIPLSQMFAASRTALRKRKAATA
jgi:electron transport complex protein RnfC